MHNFKMDLKKTEQVTENIRKSVTASRWTALLYIISIGTFSWIHGGCRIGLADQSYAKGVLNAFFQQ